MEDVINQRILRFRDYSGLSRWALYIMTWNNLPYKRKTEHKHIQNKTIYRIQKEESDKEETRSQAVKMEEGVMSQAMQI